jgi:osomolarity two-component system response regulator SKN7
VIAEVMNLVTRNLQMQDLIRYLVTQGYYLSFPHFLLLLTEAVAKVSDKKSDPSDSGDGPLLPSDQAQKLISSCNEVARASLDQMSEISRRAVGQQFGQQLQSPPVSEGPMRDIQAATPSDAASTCIPSSSSHHFSFPPSHPEPTYRFGQQNETVPPASAPPSLDAPSAVDQSGNDGLRVFTVGTLRPRTDDDPNYPAADNSLPQLSNFSNQIPAQFSSPVEGSSADLEDSEQATTLRVKRGAFVPGWAVPPRVLLVEDDDVCRKLSSKFLQVFGCSTDFAIDGVSAVNKMNLEKYDLVLMVG